MNAPRKPWPSLPSDEAAERFVAEADLSEYDWSRMEPVLHELSPRDPTIELPLPRPQLERLRVEAAKRGVPTEVFLRELLARALATLEP
ncbi:CopG family antitoxin [Salinarimonas chemoclinalis]|uniref:CopG family antitoxin n=1 Tax=Salinarimonas chemoclinalis TaxID=3241599 RepID=UPI0035584448